MEIFDQNDNIEFTTYSKGSEPYAHAGGPVIGITFPNGKDVMIRADLAMTIGDIGVREKNSDAGVVPLHDASATPDRMLQFFAYQHLRPDLQAISKPFHDIATWMINYLPSNPERTVGLRKLLEAKDCAVRAQLYKHEAGRPD